MGCVYNLLPIISDQPDYFVYNRDPAPAGILVSTDTRGVLKAFTGLCRSFNSYIDYPNRGQTYETQHDEFHNSDTPNRFLAYGALVGGPGADDKYAPSLQAGPVFIAVERTS